MILSGEKLEEYREIKDYWTIRLNIEFLPTKRIVLFRNGYGNNKPTIKCEVKITQAFGKEEWGAEPNKLYYVLKILSVEKEV